MIVLASGEVGVGARGWEERGSGRGGDGDYYTHSPLHTRQTRGHSTLEEPEGILGRSYSKAAKL